MDMQRIKPVIKRRPKFCDNHELVRTYNDDYVSIPHLNLNR